MPSVDLEDSEWQVVLGMIAAAPWRDANPLLMKIGQQLRKGHDLARDQELGEAQQRRNANGPRSSSISSSDVG